MAAGDTLINIVRFTDLAAGATSAATAHGLIVNGVAKTPDLIFKSNGDFAVVATTTTTIQVRNDGDALASCDVWCEYKHSMLRNFTPPVSALTPAPFVAAGGPTGGTTSNVLVWGVADAWADIYTAIVALDEPCILLVEYDPAVGYRTMTANGGAATNLWNVQFQGLMAGGYNFSAPRDIEIRVADTFLLGADPDSGYAILNSQNISWEFNCTSNPIVAAGPVYVQISAGRLSHSAGAYCFVTEAFHGDFSNGCRAIGTGGTGLVRLTADDNVIRVRSGATIGNSTFDTTTGAKLLTAYVEPTCEINPAAYDAAITVTYNQALLYISPDGTQWTISVDDFGAISAI